ncbi:hypothetical protein T08_10381 [Trichinella sp. T8]|nr:hypothetical protein T08_10381 [Trichinella sp. T8]
MICADENQFGIIRFEQIFHKVTYFNLANPLEKVMIQCIFSFSTDSNKKLLHFKRHTLAIDLIMCSKLKRNTCYYVEIKKFARDYFSKLSSIIT